MKSSRVFVATAAALFALGVALPASAATTGGSTATVTVQGGALSITVPTDAGSLGTLINTVGGGSISGPLGQVQVSDARSAAAASTSRSDRAARPRAISRSPLSPLNAPQMVGPGCSRPCTTRAAGRST